MTEEELNEGISVWATLGPKSPAFKAMTEQLYRELDKLYLATYTQPQEDKRLSFVAEFSLTDIVNIPSGPCQIWGIPGRIGFDLKLKPGEYSLTLLIKVM